MWSRFRRWCHLVRWSFSPWRWKEDHRAWDAWIDYTVVPDDGRVRRAWARMCSCGRQF